MNYFVKNERVFAILPGTKDIVEAIVLMKDFSSVDGAIKWGGQNRLYYNNYIIRFKNGKSMSFDKTEDMSVDGSLLYTTYDDAYKSTLSEQALEIRQNVDLENIVFTNI